MRGIQHVMAHHGWTRVHEGDGLQTFTHPLHEGHQVRVRTEGSAWSHSPAGGGSFPGWTGTGHESLHQHLTHFHQANPNGTQAPRGVDYGRSFKSESSVKIGYQQSDVTSLQKAMVGIPDGEISTVTIKIVDDGLLQKSDRTVTLPRTEWRLRLLGALTGGTGHEVVRPLDAALADRGLMRAAVYQRLFPDAPLGAGTTIVKSLEKSSPADSLKRAAADLDALCEAMKRREGR